MKTELLQATKKIGNTISKHSPVILTGIAVAGVVTTTVMAIKATPKAMEILEADKKIREETGEDPITKKEVVQLVWKCYIPTVTMGLVTISCVIGANTINAKRHAVLASLYSMTETTLREYQDKVVETIGKNKEEKIREEIHKDKMKKNPVSSKNPVIFTGKGDVLCFDALSGRYFQHQIEKIRKIQNDLNHRLLSEMWMSLNDVYLELGLDPIKTGYDLGWNTDHLIDFVFTSQLTEDGDPCLVLDCEIGPRYDYKAY